MRKDECMINHKTNGAYSQLVDHYQTTLQLIARPDDFRFRCVFLQNRFQGNTTYPTYTITHTHTGRPQRKYLSEISSFRL